MLRYLLYGIFLSIFLNFSEVEPSLDKKSPANLAFEFITRDSISINVYESYDKGILAGYYGYINTPVCSDRLCYNAEINLHWDLVGNFTHFEPIPGAPLTKNDHEPFTNDDYKKLFRILETKKPTFVYLKRDELVRKNGVDGVSSATITNVKKDMIDGAIYTCYTLWHIANGDIVFPIHENTLHKLDSKLIYKMLRSNNTAYHYFILENLAPALLAEYSINLIRLFNQNGRYYASRVLQKIPKTKLAEDAIQLALLNHLNLYNDEDLKLLFNNLMTVDINKTSLHYLIDQLSNEDRLLDNLSIKLISKNMDISSEITFLKFLKSLNAKEINLSEQHLKILNAVSNKTKEIKKLLKKIKKNKSSKKTRRLI